MYLQMNLTVAAVLLFKDLNMFSVEKVYKCIECLLLSLYANTEIKNIFSADVYGGKN